MANPPKIVLIGAGSAIFGLSSLATVIRSRGSVPRHETSNLGDPHH